jgi:ABC-type lipoprotein export system ATPase subunit
LNRFLKEFDVIRKDYRHIKSVVLDAFKKFSLNKVAAVVHGTGGCGKSTLLRRLAIELSQETDFDIMWVNDRQLKNFKENALPKIREDGDNKYLIFIEDWYRLADGEENKKIGDEILKDTQNISNI